MKTNLTNEIPFFPIENLGKPDTKKINVLTKILHQNWNLEIQ